MRRHLLLAASSAPLGVLFSLLGVACGGSSVSDGNDGGGMTHHDSGAPKEDSGSLHDSGSPMDAAPDTAPPADLITVPLSGCVPFYTAPMTIGGASFDLAVDTGSTTLGVASSVCTDCTGVSPVYTPGATAVDQHQKAMSVYGTGQWSGEIYKDDVIAAGEASSMTAMNFVAIDSQSQFFPGQPIQCGPTGKDYAIEGIIGFGPAGSALPNTEGYFDALVGSAHLADVFATELCGEGGTLWLGGYDPSVLSGPVQYTDFAISPFNAYDYIVDLQSVSAAGAMATVPSGPYTGSVVDTGTSVFILPPAAFDTITAAIAADAGFKKVFGAMASTFFSNPDNCVMLSQTAAELDATLPPITLSFGPAPGISVEANAAESYLIMVQPGVYCPAFYSNTPGPSFPLAAIVGSPMLRSNVVIFDRAKKRVGFGPHKPCD